MGSVAEEIRREPAPWPEVEAGSRRFGGTEFRVWEGETWHSHGEGLADLPFPARVRKELVGE